MVSNNSTTLIKFDPPLRARIRVKFDDGIWYPGTITRKRNDEVFVEYDDGDRHWTDTSEMELIKQ